MKVLGVGNALVDVLAHIESDNLLEELCLPRGSMQLLDEARFTRICSEVEKLESSIVSGGSASNTIIGLAKMGVDVGFIGRVGTDAYGDFYTKDLVKYEVKPFLIQADEASGVVTSLISDDGERTMGTYLGAAAKLTAADLNPQYFQGYSYCYIEGYLLQNHALITQALILAKEAGCKTVLDLASYNVVEENKEYLLEIIPKYVDIVFANEEESNILVGGNPEEGVARIASMVELAIVKAGKSGSWIQQGNSKVHVRANIVKRVDSTGAGDLYSAGFLYGLVNKLPLTICGDLGSLLAETVIQAVGPKILENKWNYIYDQVAKMIQFDDMHANQ